MPDINTPKTPSAAISSLTVVEISEHAAGEFTGKILAEFGATVVKVEPPSGAPSRHIGPYVNDETDPERSLNYWFYNTGKFGVTLDLESENGQARLADLLRSADILIYAPALVSDIPWFLTAGHLKREYPELIACVITHFGLTGPWAGYKSSDLIALAAGGPLHTSGYDDLSIPPIRPGGGQAYHCAASFAYNAILLSLINRQGGKARGDLIDVSIHDTLAVTVELANPYWTYTKTLMRRQTCRHASPVLTNPAIHLCADGKYVYFLLIVAELKAWQAFVTLMDRHGMAVDLVEPEYLDADYRRANYPHIQELTEAFLSVLDSETVYQEAQELGLPVGKLYAPEELFEEPHEVARGFFQPVDVGLDQPVKFPGPLHVFSDISWSIPRPAPRLGEHNGQFAATS